MLDGRKKNLKIFGEQMIVMEPYQSMMSEMKELIEFCEDRGLTFLIDGGSAHFPGATYRIIVKKKDENKFWATPSKLLYRR